MLNTELNYEHISPLFVHVDKGEVVVMALSVGAVHKLQGVQ